MGRPVIGKPKTTRLGIRVDEDTNDKLDYLANNFNTTKTKIVRRGIDLVIKELEENL
ncbi:hypothetical protein [uncultured Anaerococcus sp.]|uniref:hypothetical protein n=1 Tax=uncultured Anaerococcus sp. TaxID=293428 RepID=UPI0025F2871F|nr:hypothetical protein [uncultured Anaerococcus sp.]